jgi:hypothetical protein
VGAHQAAGVLDEGLDRLHQLRLGGFEATSKMKIWLVSRLLRPEEAPVVGEAGVVRFVLTGHRGPVDDLAVTAGGRVGVHGDDAVVAVRHPLHPERPHVDEVLLAGHLRQEGGLTGLVGQGGGGGRDPDGHRDRHTPATTAAACAW